MEIFNKNPDMQRDLITNHGLLPLITKMSSNNIGVLNAVLNLVTQIIDNKEILVNLCILGIIPMIMNCCNKRFDLLTRLYAAYFVQRVIATKKTFQMFVACRGLSVFPDLIDEDFKHCKELIHIAISGVSSMFKLQGQTTPKNEYFHLLANVGFLEKLSIALVNQVKAGASEMNSEMDELNYLQQTTQIFKTFSTGDSFVKSRICSDDVLPNLKSAIEKLDPKSKESLNLLHAVRNISFDRVALVKLSIMIPTLCQIGQKFISKGEFPKEIFNQATHSLFHLCRKNRTRQELAVNSGLVPFLHYVNKNNKPLKEFAVPLMCELAATSAITRQIVLKNKGVEFFLEQLRERTSFVTDALEAIAVCLSIAEERHQVEQIIFSQKHPLNDFFGTPFSQVQESMLAPLFDGLEKAITVSQKLCVALGNDVSDNGLVSVLKRKLKVVTQANAKLSLLKTLKLIKQQQPTDFLKKRDLEKLVTELASNDPSSLVIALAKTILEPNSTQS